MNNTSTKKVTSLEDIEKLSKVERQIKNEEIYYFRDTIDIYLYLIKQTAKLVKELGLPQNSISYSYVIEWLITEGVLSYSGSFNHQDDVDDKGHRTILRGAQVLLGNACCRHVAKLHEDIFNQLGLQGDSTSCMDASKKINPFETGTHHVNTINYLGIDYINDIYNNIFSYFGANRTMLPYDESYPAFVYCPYGDIAINGNTKEEVAAKIFQFDQSSKQTPLPYGQIEEITQETFARYQYGRPLIKDFEQESKPYVKRIVNDLTNPHRISHCK